MSPDPANTTSLFQMFIPLIIFAAIVKAIEIALPAKRNRRAKATTRGRDDSALRDRVTHLEKLLAAATTTPPPVRSEDSQDFPEFKVTAKRYFFSVQENRFFQTLLPIAERLGYVVFSKVRLADIVDDAKDAPRTQTNYYDRLHVDYLLVTKQEFKPILGIELNGPSHANNEQQYRDKKKRAVFKAARMPLLQFYNHTFSADEIEQKLLDAIGSSRPVGT